MISKFPLYSFGTVKLNSVSNGVFAMVVKYWNGKIFWHISSIFFQWPQLANWFTTFRLNQNKHNEKITIHDRLTFCFYLRILPIAHPITLHGLSIRRIEIKNHRTNVWPRIRLLQPKRERLRRIQKGTNARGSKNRNTENHQKNYEHLLDHRSDRCGFIADTVVIALRI